MAPPRVHITTGSIRRAMHTPGGVVNDWDRRLVNRIGRDAVRASPVNDPLNAMHRAMWSGQVPRGRSSAEFKKKIAATTVGTYKRSWDAHRTTGTNQHSSKWVIGNSAPHAVYVEFGRAASHKFQAFTWTKAPFLKMRHGMRSFKRPGWKWWLITAGPNGLIRRTRFRSGEHILRNAATKHLAAEGIIFTGLR